MIKAFTIYKPTKNRIISLFSENLACLSLFKILEIYLKWLEHSLNRDIARFLYSFMSSGMDER
jgi:hypothetical protein